MGDFNLQGDSLMYVPDFTSFLHSKFVYCTIIDSIHDTPTSTTLNDHIWINTVNSISSNGIFHFSCFEIDAHNLIHSKMTDDSIEKIENDIDTKNLFFFKQMAIYRLYLHCQIHAIISRRWVKHLRCRAYEIPLVQCVILFEQNQ